MAPPHGHRSRRDPRGFYLILGVPPGADTAEIKSAFRRRAKDLHPDRNPSPTAQDDFQHLTEAYQVLMDPARRRAYDSGNLAPLREAPRPAAPQLCTCDRCKNVPAQPRHLVFPVVTGKLWRSAQSTLEGVYCRRCADITALRLALRTWGLGWWSLPLGPVHTIKALNTLRRGGDQPRAGNHRLLLRQAQAFLSRGERDLARGTALQARAFAATAAEHRAVENILGATARSDGRRLRDRWAAGSGLRLAQLSPPALLGAAVLGALALWTDVNLWGVDDPGFVARRVPAHQTPDRAAPAIPGLARPMLLRTGRLYEVTTVDLPVRTGPGTEYHEITSLESGQVVLVTENAPEGGWVRILTATGVIGFVSGRYLTPALAAQALDGALEENGQ